MNPYERFRRNEVRSLDLSEVDAELEKDGPSHARDVDPKDILTQFMSAAGTNKPGELVAIQKFVALPFTQHGWTTYAARTFVEMEGGRRKPIASARSILALLHGTTTETANEVIWDWHRQVTEKQWRLIVRDKTKEVRLVATPEYELYLNTSFWKDVNSVSLEGFQVQKCLIDEDLFSVRIVQQVPMEGYKNLFFGIELVNSENGSASLRGRFLLYDLLCTNGMYLNLGELILFRRVHRNWDSEKVREGVREALKLVPENQGNAVKLVTALHKKELTAQSAASSMAIYKHHFDASDRFIENVLENWETKQPATAWGLVSAITLKAQDYALSQRLEHEKNAGLFATKLLEKDG